MDRVIENSQPHMEAVQEPTQLILLAPAIGIEKGKFSYTENHRTYEEIGRQLHLYEIVPQPSLALAGFGIDTSRPLPQRRRADILTTLAAGKIAENRSQDSLRAAALLLSTEYSTQGQMDSISREARKGGTFQGKEMDLIYLRSALGDQMSGKVESGQFDRLTASCLAAVAEKRQLSLDCTLDLGKALATGQTPRLPESQAVWQDLQVSVEVAKRLRSQLPRHELSRDDVPCRKLAPLAVGLVRRAQALSQANTLKMELQRSAEMGTIPDQIKSLTQILDIVDQNPEIRAVSFDLYDTLVQWTEDFADRYARYPGRAVKYFQKFGIPITEDQLRPIHQRTFDERYDKFQSKGIEVMIGQTIDSLISQAAQSTHHQLSPEQQQHLHDVLVRDWYSLELENAVAMPGARETLQQLKDRGIKICLTSNASWSHEHVRRVLGRFGLLEYFDTISLSSDIGKMKKSDMPDFYHYSWDKLKLPYHTILHVGDSMSADVVGPKNAGARATHYNNPLAYNRLEVDKIHNTGLKFMRWENSQLYAQTVVEMQKNSLEMTAEAWIDNQINRRDIPVAERERLKRLANEMYTRARDVFAPVYIQMADNMLSELNNGQKDVVISLARDGLPHSIAMKLLLQYEPDRYPNVRPDQIHYVHAPRKLLKRVVDQTDPANHEIRQKFLKYLTQKGNLQGKRVRITDIGTSGTTQFLMTEALRNLNVASVEGYYIDTPGPIPERRSFLQETTISPNLLLEIDIPLLQLETVFSGPFESVTRLDENPGNGSVRPVGKKKRISPEAQTRGLSEPSLLFLNSVAQRALIDAIRIRHRQRLAGTPDPTDSQAIGPFIRFMNRVKSTPLDQLDDLTASMPWPDDGRWYLPAKNNMLQQNRPLGR